MNLGFWDYAKIVIGLVMILPFICTPCLFAKAKMDASSRRKEFE